MGDNDKENKAPEQSKQIKELKVTVTRNLENGQLSVQGPGDGKMYDKYLCFGLMDDAKDFIKIHNTRAAKSSIFTPFSKKQKTGGAFGGRRF